MTVTSVRPTSIKIDNTKIHAVCDARGKPLRFVLTPGQRHDSQALPELLEGLRFK